MNNLHWIKTYAYNALANCFILDFLFLIQQDYIALLPLIGTTVLNVGIVVLVLQEEINNKNAGR